jgi:hypothetical protein
VMSEWQSCRFTNAAVQKSKTWTAEGKPGVRYRAVARPARVPLR